MSGGIKSRRQNISIVLEFSSRRLCGALLGFVAAGWGCGQASVTDGFDDVSSAPFGIFDLFLDLGVNIAKHFEQLEEVGCCDKVLGGFPKK